MNMEKDSTSREWVAVQRMLAEPSPFVSAKSWAVADGFSGEILFGRNETEKREVASLTKIMTAFVSLQLIQRYHIDSTKMLVVTSARAAAVCGTRAFIDEGDILFLNDLMYGLLLPSGNDAAMALAEHFGKMLLDESLPPIVPGQAKRVIFPVKRFLKEMNRYAQELGLTESFYANPHGLPCIANRSSAQDVAKLAAIAMRDPFFSEIVSCRKYMCIAKNSFGEDKTFTWKNTNKLLSKGFCGVKTGHTFNAGPCLATSIKVEGFFLVIVILNCKSMDARWLEIRKLTKWAIHRLRKMDCIILPEKIKEKKKLLQLLVHV